MTLQVALNAAGGLALFLLAMLMMTEGLKAFAGPGLKSLLERSTATPLRGVLAGIAVTGLVQSSSAVTVATIGFVNAGVLTLRQALGVIFGTNVGTTMTGWLVSLVGFGFKVDAFALPILSVGVALRLLAAGKRRQGLGEALAGFGLFFLGLALLKDAFGGLAGAYGADLPAGDGFAGWAMFILTGFVATVLTQSSSAALAIILTAAAGGIVGIEAAAAAVIGANLGTTSTAAVAVLRATPAAKRLALGHIAFNVVTGVVALLLLPLLLWLVRLIGTWLELDGSPAVVLALFHTVFNVLGVVIMLPASGRIAAFLERLFRSAEEDIGRPRFLDATLAATPELAVSALHEELLRLRAMVRNGALAAVSGAGAAQSPGALRALSGEIAKFVAAVRTESMPREAADGLASALRACRYLDEAASMAPRAAGLHARLAQLPESPRVLLAQSLAEAAACVAAGDEAPLQSFARGYERTKGGLLRAAVEKLLSVEDTDALLDALSALRRMVEQLAKADRLVDAPRAAGSKSS